MPADRTIISGLRGRHRGPSRSRYIHVAVHPTVEELRVEARKHEKKRPYFHQESQLAPDLLGIFQPSEFKSRYDHQQNKWVDTTDGYAGIIRLSRQTARDSGIVAHEAAHAAFHIVRLEDWALDDHEGLTNIDQSMEKEEDFCYLLGNLVYDLNVYLWALL